MNRRADFTPRYVGNPVERVEDLHLLRGKGQFVDDHHLEGLLHAAVLRSTVAHGRIRSIDTRRALAIPGVHAVYTAKDIAGTQNASIPTITLRLAALKELERFGQPIIASNKVHYVGEPIALVVADSVAIAEDALEAIDVEIDTLPAVPDCAAAIAGRTLLFEDFGSNIAVTYTASKGDPDNASAPYVRRERFKVQRHSAVCMEPRGVVAIWEEAGPKLTVLGAAKIPFQNRKVLAQQMDLPEECVEMIEGDVGGGFGVRGNFHPEDYLIPFAARRLRRPVKWVEDRRENLLNTNHAREVEIELEIACERDGTIVRLQGAAWTDAGGYFRTSAGVPGRNVAQFLSGPYRIANIRVQSSLVMTNKCPIGTYRGPGRFEADFFRERLFDMAASDLGIDRVEFRRRNLPASGEMPYPIATVAPPVKAESLDSGDYAAALDRCLAEFDWAGKSGLQGKCVDGRYHGLGVGCFIEGGAAGPRENARISVDQSGVFSVYVGSANVGQGVHTVMGQIAADALGVSLERVRVYTGSTTYLKEGFGAYHSRSVVMGGCAVVDAADKLKAEIAQRAARRFGCEPAEVGFDASFTASNGKHSVQIGEIARDAISIEGTYANLDHKHTYAYGAAAAHVAVDPGTGHVELLEYVTVEDVGRVINPLTTKGQVVGAVVQGLGGALLEHLQYDENGQFLTGSLADYLMPTSTDFPNIKAIVLEDYPSPTNPLGAKGGGEGGIVPVGGLIANAVANALSTFKVEPRELPLTPPKVWALIRAGAGRE